MSEPILPIIAVVFLLAGFVKGTIGLGLPTVAMVSSTAIGEYYLRPVDY